MLTPSRLGPVAFCSWGGVMALWCGKKYVKVFQPTTECKLGLSELLVYSYYAYQDAFDTSPEIMQVVRGVGLARILSAEPRSG